jgi:hypothetical protein
MTVERIIFWIGFAACILGGACVLWVLIGCVADAWGWMWHKLLGAGRTTVWMVRFTRHWREFNEWHKQNKEAK